MITKKFGVDFDSAGGALTLDPWNVTADGYASRGTHTRTHEDSGWTITGELHEDYYWWVNKFTASHPVFGCVEGDFDYEVVASSEEAFAHFWAHHQPVAWDYHDI
jgi:hypothetical protein